MKNLTYAAFFAAISLWISSQPVSGATTNVTVGFNGALRFSPTNVLISVNDSVIWQWISASPNHSTTSGTNDNHGDDNGVPCGLWDSGLTAGVGHLFTNTFTSAGVFSYYCSAHWNFGMTGQVFVASAAAPPTISITSPSPGTILAAPANVTIQAGVTNGSSAVTNVQFLAGTAVITNETSGPFSATTNNVEAGSYTLTVIAKDDNGLSATNAIPISVVTPVTVSLANLMKFSGTNFQFTYSVNTGLDYVVQRSTNLMVWVPLVTNTAASNPAVFVDTRATNSLNFYRVGRLPNP
jgi:plastocyanin